MKQERLILLINAVIRGNITEKDHRTLQQTLKADSQARQIYRDRIDLEAALHTWASESADASVKQAVLSAKRSSRIRRQDKLFGLLAAAAVVLFLVAPSIWRTFFPPEPQQLIVVDDPTAVAPPGQLTKYLGVIRQQEDCVWAAAPITSAGRFPQGTYTLTTGVAELRFDSGTNVVLEAPCELAVVSADAARLFSGNVFVHVTEISDGFTLDTPESRILDLGTEYAVAIDEESTEVHVFDGSVLWIPQDDAADGEDEIEAGEAKRYQRSDPALGTRIPFGKRQFVRRLEAELQEYAGDDLLAYDGFENLAGRIRRGRSGFGWLGGWQSAGRGRGKLAEVVETPNDTVFGMDRAGRRMFLLQESDDIRREFDVPITVDEGRSLYVSLLAEHVSGDQDGERSLRVSLETNTTSRRHRGYRQRISFGVSPETFPYINSGGSITETASRTRDNEVCLCVFKLSHLDQGETCFLRVYQLGDQVDANEPSSWTVAGGSPLELQEYPSIRITVGSTGRWHLDELKVGTTWRSVTSLLIEE